MSVQMSIEYVTFHTNYEMKNTITECISGNKIARMNPL